MATERHGTAFVVGAALGGIAGGLWGLLNAPEPRTPAGSGFGDVFQRAADKLVVSAADLEVNARAWLARDQLRDPVAWAPAAADTLWAEAPSQVDIVLDGPRPRGGPGASAG